MGWRTLYRKNKSSEIQQLSNTIEDLTIKLREVIDKLTILSTAIENQTNLMKTK